MEYIISKLKNESKKDSKLLLGLLKKELEILGLD